jgi:uncharacterized protein DUF5615
MTPRFFTDEDVYGAIASGLRQAGFDAISTPEAGRLGESDESQLSWAAATSRVLVTFNVAHFAALHVRWLQAGRQHAGITVSSQRSIGDLLHRLIRMSNALDSGTMQNRIEFLSDW